LCYTTTKFTKTIQLPIKHPSNVTFDKGFKRNKNTPTKHIQKTNYFLLTSNGFLPHSIAMT